MRYEERRFVILPCGRLAEEVRTQEDEVVRYRYEQYGVPMSVEHLKIEYNGQILDAQEPDEEDMLGILGV